MGKNLIIFMKNPQLGFVKTRLARTVGDKRALDIYLQLVEKCKLETQQVKANRFLYYSKSIETTDPWNGMVFQKRLQFQGDLGERMQTAFQEIGENKKGPIIIIGCDCYDLTANIIEQAFEALKKCDLVIGPANDGGYYLLGLNHPDSDLFKGIDWSTEKVFRQTMEIVQQKKMTYTILQELIDLDTFEDLEKSGFPKH